MIEGRGGGIAGRGLRGPACSSEILVNRCLAPYAYTGGAYRTSVVLWARIASQARRVSSSEATIAKRT
jgi:hypothetical protein